MNKIFCILALLFLVLTGCDKNNSCNEVTITNQSTPCNAWAIKVGSKVYPSRNIPDQFKQEGLSVCAEYDLFEDMAMCACCGGTWANVKAMETATH